VGDKHPSYLSYAKSMGVRERNSVARALSFFLVLQAFQRCNENGAPFLDLHRSNQVTVTYRLFLQYKVVPAMILSTFCERKSALMYRKFLSGGFR
jgi:hypothetical protein